MVYHLGERALVELHVVLDENLPLKVTHDVCEALERKVTKILFNRVWKSKKKRKHLLGDLESIFEANIRRFLIFELKPTF